MTGQKNIFYVNLDISALAMKSATRVSVAAQSLLAFVFVGREYQRKPNTLRIFPFFNLP